MSDCTAAELKKRIDEHTAPVIIDVREAAEVALCRIPGALHVPMNTIPARIEELRRYADKEVVVYCHHGIRSASVRNYLMQNGFSTVRNLAGGIDVYSAAADPTIPRY